MSRWKVLAATPFLLIPVAFAGISFGDGIEHQTSRPAVVLPAAALGPQVTMRPVDPGEQTPRNGGPDPSGGPSSQRPEQDPGCTDDDQDDDRDDDRDDVQVVQPCPDYVGDDEHDAHDEDDDREDREEDDGDDADDD